MQPTGRPVWGDVPIFSLNLAITLEGLPTLKLKLCYTGHPYNLYILCIFESVPKDCGKGAWAMASKVAANDARQFNKRNWLWSNHDGRNDLQNSKFRLQKGTGHSSNSKTAKNSMERKKISNQLLFNQSSRFEKWRMVASTLPRWFGAMMFGELWSCIDWSAWWAEATVLVVRQGSEHCS